MQPIYTRGSLQARSLMNLRHVPSTTPLIALPCFHLLNSKYYYRLFEFLNDALLHMQTDALTLEHLKCFKQSFKIVKPEALKATSFRR